MYCTTSDGGAARFRGIASVGKQATSDTGNCGRRENTRDLEAPCNSLPFPGIRSTPGRVTYSGFLTLLGSGSPEFRSQARGSGSPTHCHPSMSGEDTPISIPPLGSPSLVPSKDDPRGSGSFTRSAEAAGSLASSGIWLMHSASVAPTMKPAVAAASWLLVISCPAAGSIPDASGRYAGARCDVGE
jgi:hypothetical protein